MKLPAGLRRLLRGGGTTAAATAKAARDGNRTAKGDEMPDNRLGGLEAAVRARQSLTAAVHLLCYATVAAAAAAVLAVGVAVWALLREPEPVYFATRTDGGLVQLVPLDQPHLSDTQVLNFAVEALTGALTMDFANWRDDLTRARQFFTKPGFDAFVSELERSGTLELIRVRRMTSSAVANGAVILDRGTTPGGYLWRIEMRLVVTYESSVEHQRQELVGVIDVVRVSTLDSFRGVAVHRFAARPER